jgi:uncharacterized glyoxalase superfamily protein PhnB
MQPVYYSGLAVLALALASASATPRTSDETMKKLTPVIFVEAVEPCIAFWIDRLGFEKTAEVPEGDRLGFAAVSAGNVEVMYQSRASVAKDIPTLAEGPFHKSGGLFIEVSDLDAIKVKLEGAELIFPERTTFYGAREIAVRAPCGTAVIFAEMTQG